METSPSTASSAASSFVTPSILAFAERLGRLGHLGHLGRLGRRLRRLFRDERANGVNDGASLGSDVQRRVARFRREDDVESTS